MTRSIPVFPADCKKLPDRIRGGAKVDDAAQPSQSRPLARRRWMMSLSSMARCVL